MRSIHVRWVYDSVTIPTVLRGCSNASLTLLIRLFAVSHVIDETALRAACAEVERLVASGVIPAVEQILSDGEGALGDEELVELVYCELVARESTDRPVTLAELSRRYPHLSDRWKRLCEVHDALAADSPTLDSRRSGSTAIGPGDMKGAGERTEEVKGGGGDAHGIRTLGPYDLHDQIGEGSMGMVYRARQRSLRRTVAVKILSPIWSQPEARQRFRTEAKAAAKLQHPHVVQIIDVGEIDDTPYMAMEMLTGGTLAQRLAREELSHRESADLVATLARTIEFAHDRGIVHRDLKPANILMTHDGQPKIADFGLAKILDTEGFSDRAADTRTGMILGTPGYMAPEQADPNGGPIDGRADVYALGAILYECTTGRPPFRAESPWETLRQVHSQDPVAPRRFSRSLPRDLETICLHCLHKDPARRYRSAGALASDLQRFVTGRTIAARPANLVERGTKLVRRNVAVTLLSLLCAVAFLSGLTGVIWQWRRAERLLAMEQVSSYYQRIALAQFQLTDYNSDAAVELLSQCPAHHRGWEWDYLRTQCEQESAVLRGHTQCVRGISFSDDGTFLYSVAGRWGTSDAGEIRRWALGDHPAAAGCRTTDRPVMDVSYCPVGDRIVTAGLDFRGKSRQGFAVWDGAAFEPIYTAPSRYGGQFACDVGQDGQTVVTGGADGIVRIWDINTGRLRHACEGHSQNVFAVSVSPDSSLAVSASRDRTVRVWSTETGQQLFEFDGEADMRCVSFSPQGNRVYAGGYSGRLASWWLLPSFLQTRRMLTLPVTVVCAIDCSPDGELVAVGDETGRLRMWNADLSQEVSVIGAHRQATTAVAFSSNGAFVATGGSDGDIKIWPVGGQRRQQTVVLGFAAISAPVVTRDGRFWFTGPKLHLGFGESFSRKEILRFDTENRESSVFAHVDAWVRAMSLSDDETRLAAVSDEGRLWVWDLGSGEIQFDRQVNSAGPATGVLFDGTGTHIVTAGENGQLLRWNLSQAATPSVVWQHSDRLSSMARYHGHLLVTTQQGDVYIGPIEKSSREIDPYRRLQGFGQSVDAMAVSETGDMVAVAVGDTIHAGPLRPSPRATWSVRTLRGHQDTITALGFHPDGTRLFSASEDSTLRIWEPSSSREILSIPIPEADAPEIIIDLCGKYVAVTDSREVYILDSDTTAVPIRRSAESQVAGGKPSSPQLN